MKMSDKTTLAIPSPCVGFCRLDEASGLCVGCARSAAEIAAWKSAPSEILERVWSELPGRRERLGIGLHRLGWDCNRIRSFVSESVRAGGGTWVYEAVIVLSSVFLGGLANFSLSIQGRIFVINAAALVGLVVLHWAGVAVGIASRSRFFLPGASRAA